METIEKPTKEQKALIELRQLLADVIEKDPMFNDDYFLLQWLKSQNLRVNNTEISIRDSIKWREENNVRTLGTQGLSETGIIAQDLPIIIDGVSKTGIPVILLSVGGLDFGAIIDKHGKEAIYNYFTQVYAKVEQLMIAYNKKNNNKSTNDDLKEKTENVTWNTSTGVIVIVNVKNFSLLQATSPSVAQVILNGAKIIMKYFPAIVSCAYFINMNMFFNILFKILRPVLSSPSMKLEPFGCDEEKWRAALSQFVDEDQLTPEFGGCKVVPPTTK